VAQVTHCSKFTLNFIHTPPNGVKKHILSTLYTKD